MPARKAVRAAVIRTSLAQGSSNDAFHQVLGSAVSSAPKNTASDRPAQSVFGTDLNAFVDDRRFTVFKRRQNSTLFTSKRPLGKRTIQQKRTLRYAQKKACAMQAVQSGPVR